MQLNYTGSQMLAFRGLLQNVGLSAPDITARLTEYFTRGAVQEYHDINSNITNIPVQITLSTINAVWQPSTAYIKGTVVQNAGQSYKAVHDVIGSLTFTGAPDWAAQALTAGTLFDVQWTLGYAPPSWLTIETIFSNLTGATFSNNFTSVHFATAIPPTIAVPIYLNLRKIFYKICENLPHVIDATPQQFVNYLGDGPLLTRAYSRTAQLFPPGEGAQVFSNVLSQASGYANQTADLTTAAAQSQWGVTESAEHTVTAGWSSLVGDSQAAMIQFGTALVNAGNLVNLQHPQASFSAAQVLLLLFKEQDIAIKNVNQHFLNQSVPGPESGPFFINTSANSLPALIQNNTKRLIRDSELDQTLQGMADLFLDSNDVWRIADFLGVTVDYKKLHKFSDLLNEQLYFGTPTDAVSIAGKIKAITGKNSVAEAMLETLPANIEISFHASPNIVGLALQNIRTLENLTELQASTHPLSESDYKSLLAYIGLGSGPFGTLRAADCLGEINYYQVLNEILGVLGYFTNGLGLPTGSLALVKANYQALRTAVLGANPSLATLTNGHSYATWDLLLITAKQLIDSEAAILLTQISQFKLENYLHSYNRLAETHNVSTYLGATVPFSFATGFVPSAGGTGGTITKETQIAGIGQTVFTLTTMTYSPGSNTLSVFLDGIHQLIGISYIETNSITVTFTEAIPTDTQVMFESINFSAAPTAVGPFVPSGTAESRNSIISFVQQLPAYGVDSNDFQANLLIENCCENNITGESIRSALREAANYAILSNVGIGNDGNSGSAIAMPLDNSAPGLVGGGAHSDPVDPYVGLTDSLTGF